MSNTEGNSSGITCVVVSIDTAADQPGVVYAAFNDGEAVVRSSDSGESWETVVTDDTLPRNYVRGIAVDPAGDIAYLYTDGNGVYRIASGRPTALGPDIKDPHFLRYGGATMAADGSRIYFHAFPLAAAEDDIFSQMELYVLEAETDEIRTLDMPENPACVTAHPTDPATVYFGGWSWVWESPDRGQTWTALSNGFVDRYFAAVGVNHDNPGTVLPGSICSTGLSVSHDSGETFKWKRSGLEPFHEGTFDEHYVMRIAANGQRIYATTAAGLLISEDNGRSWELLETEFSGDGNLVKGGSELARHLHGLAVHPDDPRIVYVGTGSGDAGSHKDAFDGRTGIWKSTDGGQTWHSSTTEFPTDRDTSVSDIRISRQDPDIVYLATNAKDYLAGGKGAHRGEGLGAYRSTDGGQTWESLETTMRNIHSIALDAATPKQVYASSPLGLYRSTEVVTVGKWLWVVPREQCSRIRPSLTSSLLVRRWTTTTGISWFRETAARRGPTVI